MASELTDKERIAVLETRFTAIEDVCKTMNTKLDSLLELKAKGMGAFWLIGLIVGSGILGLFLAVSQWLGKPHL